MRGDSIPMPLRGWIVPVGDAIPDRRRAVGGGAKQSLAGRIPKQSLGTTGRRQGGDRETTGGRQGDDGGETTPFELFRNRMGGGE